MKITSRNLAIQGSVAARSGPLDDLVAGDHLALSNATTPKNCHMVRSKGGDRTTGAAGILCRGSDVVEKWTRRPIRAEIS